MINFIGHAYYFKQGEDFLPREVAIVNLNTQEVLTFNVDLSGEKFSPTDAASNGWATRHLHGLRVTPHFREITTSQMDTPYKIMDFIGSAILYVKGKQQLKLMEWMGIPALDLMQMHPNMPSLDNLSKTPTTRNVMRRPFEDRRSEQLVKNMALYVREKRSGAPPESMQIQFGGENYTYKLQL